jgi:hypothetical protein
VTDALRSEAFRSVLDDVQSGRSDLARAGEQLLARVLADD